MVSSGEELFHRSMSCGKDRQPQGGHHAEAIRNWLLFRERTRVTLQSINCGD